MEIKIAKTEDEIEAIAALRYKIYVEELNVYSSAANHRKRTLRTEQDMQYTLLYCEQENKVVGAISLILGAKTDIPEELIEVYDISRFEKLVPHEKIGIAIQLITDPAYRNTTLSFQLMSEATKLFVQSACELLFCTCQPHLINLYLRIGFFSYQNDIYNDPEFGIMLPLVMLMGDKAHFQDIQSPLRGVLNEGKYDPELVEPLHEVLGNASVLKERQQFIEDDLDSTYDMLADSKQEKVPIFSGLSKKEVKEVVELGNVIKCLRGDAIIKSGQQTNTVFILLSGSLEVRRGHQVLATIQSGEVLGELSFLLKNRHSLDVVVGENGAKILCLNSTNLLKYLETASTISSRLLLNISRSLALRLAQTNAMIYSKLY